MSLLSLPAELLYSITGELSSDTEALQATSLACKALVEPSQTLLFRSVDLDVDYKADEFLHLLEASPHIPKYVKFLKLSEKKFDNEHKYYYWAESTSIDEIINLLAPYVRSLAVSLERRKPYESNHSRLYLPEVEKLSLVEELIIEETSLDVSGEDEGEEYSGDDALVALCNKFPHLRSLRIWNTVNNTVGSSRPAEFPTPVFKLQTLEIWRCYDRYFLEWLPCCITSLKSLNIPTPGIALISSPSIVPRFISTAGTSLEEIGLQLCNNVSPTSQLLTQIRTHNINLHTFCVLILKNNIEFLPDLSVLASYSRLRYLIVHIWYCEQELFKLSDIFPKFESAILDGDSNPFPALERVEVRRMTYAKFSIVHFTFPRRDDKSILLAMFRQIPL